MLAIQRQENEGRYQ